MKKLLLLAVTATMLVGATGGTSASTITITHRIPDTGYQYGYRAGTNWLTVQSRTMCDIKKEWHAALTNVANYESQGDTGHADWWQGYADSLHYADNDECSGPDCPCNF